MRGAGVKKARLKRGLSQAELAKEAGVSQPLISQIESGKSGDTEAYRKVCKVLRLKVKEKNSE